MQHLLPVQEKPEQHWLPAVQESPAPLQHRPLSQPLLQHSLAAPQEAPEFLQHLPPWHAVPAQHSEPEHALPSPAQQTEEVQLPLQHDDEP